MQERVEIKKFSMHLFDIFFLCVTLQSVIVKIITWNGMSDNVIAK